MLYLSHKRDKEIQDMKNHIWYMNTETGEITQDHGEAMGWYRNRIEVKLMDYSETLGEWIERGAWVW